jgi:hypothetical protein
MTNNLFKRREVDESVEQEDVCKRHPHDSVLSAESGRSTRHPIVLERWIGVDEREVIREQPDLRA